MEEKYGKHRPPGGVQAARDVLVIEGDEGTESSTDSEDEDDEGILASESLDAQINATLKAIRAKDPCVYDEKSTFYSDADNESQHTLSNSRHKEKPMYLSDYHRRNLLARAAGQEEDVDMPMTYAQMQDDLKSTMVREMHAATNGTGHQIGEAGNSGEADSRSDDEEDFLVRKPSTTEAVSHNEVPKAPTRTPTLDVEAADKDPETYLSNFMNARAWIPSAGSQFQPFESDDEKEDQRAEAFEEAYNLRFENPNNANEKLISHARDAAAKYSVRQEDPNNRKKLRDAERARREAVKRERDEEKARLRKLRMAEAEEKVNKIKQAAGLRGLSLKAEDWTKFLDEGWDDDRWEEEMKRQFGDEYYADDDSGEETFTGGKGKMRKPKWEDNIDIKDLIPDFESDDGKGNTQFALSDVEEDAPATLTEDDLSGDMNGVPIDDTLLDRSQIKDKRKSNTKRNREEQKQAARKDRRTIEKIVNEKLNAEDTFSGKGSKKAGHFRYRDTSPVAFGLTARDILMAEDSQLNQFAGLKKMATFRDTAKKRKDRKHLGKKARLREWRKETFGDEQGPQKSLADLFLGQGAADTASKPGTLPHVGRSEGRRPQKYAEGGTASRAWSS